MNPVVETLDHNTLGHLVAANAVRGANIVGEPGGWGVVIRHGRLRQRLAATRSKQARVFKRFETLVSYLKEMGISRFDVDATEFDATVSSHHSRPDTSATLKQAHAALAHDKWVRAQVVQALEQAAAPGAEWVSNEEVMALSKARRAAWRSAVTTTVTSTGTPADTPTVKSSKRSRSPV